ncbi:MAG: hypothetical protein ACI87N_000615 [Flavobacteriales bacterium]|jgi:hypothetical protein
MKTKTILLSLLTVFLGLQMQAQRGTRVNAVNNDISDNLDLRAVADIFGDSRNLADFERRLNDPEFQISNLDLNDDNEVDYLRVIETVESNIHVVIIQSVLARDVYQDVATIDIERNQSNKIQVQIVGNEYMYGPNYIYEPVYYSTPVIYASFWSYNYRPYVSNWYWNYYPTYYTAWNPYPVFRYRNNININLNFNNSYNYVDYRRSTRAVVVYNTCRSNGYERQNPNYSFSRRNSEVTNRYELDQRRGTRNTANYSRGGNDSNREITSRRTGRDYTENRSSSSRSNNNQRSSSPRDYSSNDSQNRKSDPSGTTNSRDYSQNRGNSSRESSSQDRGRSAAPQRDYSQNRDRSSRESSSQSAERSAAPQRDFSQNRGSSSRESSSQSIERNVPQRESSQNRTSNPRERTDARQESQKSSPQGRGSNNNSRNGNRNT